MKPVKAASWVLETQAYRDRNDRLIRGGNATRPRTSIGVTGGESAATLTHRRDVPGSPPLREPGAGYLHRTERRPVIFGTTEKLKFKNLKRRLRLSFWEVVGVLEGLWLVTYSNAPDGDIGKLTDEEIAAALEWDGNAADLVAALVECRWVDRAPEPYRLLIHDWPVHCSSSHRSNYKRWNKLFAQERIAKERPMDGPKDAPMDSPKDDLLTQPILTQPTHQPTLVEEANDAFLEASRVPGGRAGGRASDSWGEVRRRLGELKISRWRECISEGKQAGCTPELALKLIDYGVANNYGPGAIVVRIRKAVPTLAIEAGWPDKPKPVPEVARVAADPREVLEQLRFDIIKSGQKAGKPREAINLELIAAGLEP